MSRTLQFRRTGLGITPPSGFAPPEATAPLVSLAPTDAPVLFPELPSERVFTAPPPIVETVPVDVLSPLVPAVPDLTPSSPSGAGGALPLPASAASSSWLSSPWVWLVAGVAVYWWLNDRRR